MCFCLCIKPKNSKDLTETEKRVNIYRIGAKKVLNELDCVNIMTRLRQLDLLVSLYLSSHQKVLLHFSKQNLIREETDGRTSSEEEDDNKVY
jgi:hypothetical protein